MDSSIQYNSVQFGESIRFHSTIRIQFGESIRAAWWCPSRFFGKRASACRQEPKSANPWKTPWGTP